MFLSFVICRPAWHRSRSVGVAAALETLPGGRRGPMSGTVSSGGKEGNGA
jgi:hypothetical protein